LKLLPPGTAATWPNGRRGHTKVPKGGISSDGLEEYIVETGAEEDRVVAVGR
jgi:hypothetical protein